MSIKQIQLGDRLVGPGAPVYVIAEAGVNHNGSVEMALQLVDAAVAAGADAVKFQSFVASELITAAAPKAEYQLQTTDPAESQLEMVQRLELSVAAHEAIIDYCRKAGIQFLSTPFDRMSADRLQALGVPAFKIASGDLTDWPLLNHVARFGKPIILSTGMSYLNEVADSLSVIRKTAEVDVILLHCVSNYPASPADANLRAMRTMARTFQLPVGYSDHTTGVEVALAAVALGACVIEKHFTLDCNLPGPDHKASVEPSELNAMIAGIRKVEAALGDGQKTPATSELDTASVARKSLTAAVDIRAGSKLTPEMVAMRRPGTGLPPRVLNELTGRVFRVDVLSGTMLSEEMFE